MKKIKKLENYLQINEHNELVSGLEPATNDQLQEKVNEIIDYLNQSQKQPEYGSVSTSPDSYSINPDSTTLKEQPEKKEAHHHFGEDGYCIRCGISAGEVQSVLCKDTEKQEEWREEIELLIVEIIGYANGAMIDKVDTKVQKHFNTKANEVLNKVSQLLSERTRETAKEIWKICAKHKVPIKVKWEIESKLKEEE